jgi:hypothetical protein
VDIRVVAAFILLGETDSLKATFTRDGGVVSAGKSATIIPQM